jgi:hypothetical protein
MPQCASYLAGAFERAEGASGPDVARAFGEPGIVLTVIRPPYTDYEVMEMQLDAREISLVAAFRRLAPDTAAELSALAERLATIAPNGRIDWSDSWSDEDLKEFRSASLKRFETEESEESN